MQLIATVAGLCVSRVRLLLMPRLELRTHIAMVVQIFDLNTIDLVGNVLQKDVLREFSHSVIPRANALLVRN